MVESITIIDDPGRRGRWYVHQENWLLDFGALLKVCEARLTFGYSRETIDEENDEPTDDDDDKDS